MGVQAHLFLLLLGRQLAVTVGRARAVAARGSITTSRSRRALLLWLALNAVSGVAEKLLATAVCGGDDESVSVFPSA